MQLLFPQRIVPKYFVIFMFGAGIEEMRGSITKALGLDTVKLLIKYH